jgi:Raf kinase inhibitor-like YbhB/YbcL family protein
MRIPFAAACFALTAFPAAAMNLASTDFSDGTPIPKAHNYPRCGGQNVSPELHWSGAPQGTQSLAVTMIDTDVQPNKWSHWIVVNLPPATTSLARGLTSLPAGATAIASNYGDAAYDGPCPPAGSGLHHYKFTIWALPVPTIAINPASRAIDVEATMLAYSTDSGELVGTVAP